MVIAIVMAVWLASVVVCYPAIKREWLRDFGTWTVQGRVVAGFVSLVGPLTLAYFAIWHKAEGR